METSLRVLALMPHPDDMEILCAGTLIRLVSLGAEVHVVTMTPGDKGSATLSREEISAIRREEARKGAESIGATSYTCLEYEDVEIGFDDGTRRAVVEALRRAQPNLVLTTAPYDYMFDHTITSELVRNACFNASLPNFRTGGDAPPTAGVPYLYYADTLGGHDIYGNPSPVTCRVDISAVIDAKAEALAQHSSQREWLRRQHGIDEYIDSMRRWGAIRGAEAGVEYAEAFQQHLGHPHPQDCILATLLGAIKPT